MRFLPSTVVIIFVGPIAGRLSDRIGPRPLMTLGLLFVVDLAVLAGLPGARHAATASSSRAFVLMGLGMGLVMSPMSTAAMNAVDQTKAGVASGVLSMSRMVGGTFGVAVMGALITDARPQPARRPAARVPAEGQVDKLVDALGAGGARDRRARRATPSRPRSSTPLNTACASAPSSRCVGARRRVAADREDPAARAGARDREERLELDLVEAGDAGGAPQAEAALRRARARLSAAEPTAAAVSVAARAGPRDVRPRRRSARCSSATSSSGCASHAPKPEVLQEVGDLLGLRPPRDRGLAWSSASARRSTTTATRALLVFYGARTTHGAHAQPIVVPVEFHFHVTRHGIVTVRHHNARHRAGRAPARRRCSDIDTAEEVALPRPRRARRPPGTRRCRRSTTRSTRLEDEILEDADTDQRLRLLEIKHSLVAIRADRQRPARRARRAPRGARDAARLQRPRGRASRCATSSTACRWSPSRSTTSASRSPTRSTSTSRPSRTSSTRSSRS